jgi:hypothetical protein
MYEFLATLPAILGIVGFIVYKLLEANRQGSQLSKDIVTKLRLEQPERFKEHAQLNSEDLVKLLEQDNDLRSKVSNQDFQLLRQSLTHAHTQAVVVYVICAILFLVGAALYTYRLVQPEPLKIDNITVSSTHEKSEGIPVDTDPLEVRWESSGQEKELRVSLANVNSGERGREIQALSTDGRAIFAAEDYSSILVNRNFPGINRIRVILQADDEVYRSNPLDLHVGLMIMAVNFGKRLKIAATIDRSLYQSYDFEALLVAWSHDGNDTLSLGGVIDGQKNWPLSNSDAYNWQTAKIVYLGPDDPRYVRTEVNSD